MPVPMAAPETPALRQARLRIVAALGLLAILGVLCEPLSHRHAGALVASLAALVVFLAFQTPLWLRAKTRADDAWLMREKP